MKYPLILKFLFLAATCVGQSPRLQFNHAFLVLDSSDYTAFINSQFIKNEFAGFFVRSTNTNSMSWTGAYIFGDNNYLEIFAPSGSSHPTGNSAISLGTDYTGDLLKIQKDLDKDYKTLIELKERKLKDSLVPWFQALYIVDSSGSSRPAIDFWVMEYQKAYFTFNQWEIKGDSVTREKYLVQHEEKRKNKYLKRLTGIVFYADNAEIGFYNALLLKCGFSKSGKNAFVSSEGFKISFESKQPGRLYSIKSIQFVTSRPTRQDLAISDHIQLSIRGEKGKITFK